MTAHDHRRPCRRCGRPMETVLFGLPGDPFCVACLEPIEDEPAEGDVQPAAGRHGEGE